MSPNELKILRLAQELGPVDRRTISRKMAISTEYADCLLKSLSRHGYLDPISLGANFVYAFTEEGRIALLNDLFQLQARLQKKIDWLTYQRDRVNERILALARAEAEEAEPAQAETPQLQTAQVGKA